jgi:hypothetical protein
MKDVSEVSKSEQALSGELMVEIHQFLKPVDLNLSSSNFLECG